MKIPPDWKYEKQFTFQEMFAFGHKVEANILIYFILKSLEMNI